jgi:endonuclease/exonuclease/phosphatase (EEP) superfamily protein YafD
MEWPRFLENVLNFTPQIAAFLLVVAAFAVFRRRWLIAATGLLVVLLVGAYVFRSDALLARAGDCSNAGPTLRIATFNLQGGRGDLDAFAHFAEEHDVQVVVLQELTFEAAFRARALDARYPYSVVSNPAWVAILSTDPLAEVGSYNVFGQTEQRRIWQATLTEPFAARLIFFHAQNSRSELLNTMRLDQYEVVEQVLAADDAPAIVAGDMNATVLDRAFAAMLRATGLRSAIEGTRDSPSWPSGLGWFGIRIDHVLERGYQVCDVTIGPDLGSDHRPVAVELAPLATAEG